MRGEDAYKEDYEHIELFDEPGLFTNGRIDRETVPAGWYCYDLRGSDDDPGDPTTVEEQVTVNHAGTVLLPKALKLNKVDIEGTRYRKIGEGLNFLDGEITLEEFCKEHGLVFPDRKLRYELKPIPEDEFSRLGSDDEATEPYAIGYVRIDFGRNGTEFWNTWWPKNEDKFNTPAFKTALQEFIDDLRAVGPLRDRRGMEKYCSQHADGNAIHGWGTFTATPPKRSITDSACGLIRDRGCTTAICTPMTSTSKKGLRRRSRRPSCCPAAAGCARTITSLFPTICWRWTTTC